MKSYFKRRSKPRKIKPTGGIQFKNFTAAFGEREVIRGLTCNLPANSITALIGASGSGKTTLLRVLCRMNDRIENFRIEGSILVDGVDIYRPGTNVYALRRKVGMIFQKPCVFPKSIFDNVVLRGQGSGKDIQKGLPGPGGESIA